MGRIGLRRDLSLQRPNRGWVGRLFGSGNTLNSKGPVGNAPVLDETAKGVVGDEGEVGKRRARDGAGGVAGADPVLDAGSVVGLTRANGDRVTHELERDRTPEVVWDLNTHIQWL